jgi:hypothetical protein
MFRRYSPPATEPWPRVLCSIAWRRDRWPSGLRRARTKYRIGSYCIGTRSPEGVKLSANALRPAPIHHAGGPIDAPPSVRGDAGVIPIVRESKHTQLRPSGDNRRSRHSRDLALLPASQSRDAAAPLESQPPGRTRRMSKHLRKQLRSIASLASKISLSFPANPETRSKFRNWAAALKIVRKARKLQCRQANFGLPISLSDLPRTCPAPTWLLVPCP